MILESYSYRDTAASTVISRGQWDTPSLVNAPPLVWVWVGVGVCVCACLCLSVYVCVGVVVVMGGQTDSHTSWQSDRLGERA